MPLTAQSSYFNLPQVDLYGDRTIPGQGRLDKPMAANNAGWQKSYTYNSPLGGTYESPWSPDYVESLRTSAQTPAASYSYGTPSLSSYLGTDLNSFLSNLANLKTQVQAPALAEQARQFNLTNDLARTQAGYNYSLGQGSLANQATELANNLQIQLGVNANTAKQIANSLTLGQGTLANQATELANNLQVQLGVNANQAQQIANNLLVSQGELGLQNRAQTFNERQYSDALGRSDMIRNYLMALLPQTQLTSPLSGNSLLTGILSAGRGGG